eukprot:scaffold28301_cov70-Phaeocystis_antarctica.AAC.2
MAATIAATGSNDTATDISRNITLKQITLPQPSCRVIAACGAKGVQNDSMTRVRAMRGRARVPCQSRRYNSVLGALRRPRCELEVGVSAPTDPGKMRHQAEAGQLGPHVEAGREREHSCQPQRHTSADTCWSAWEESVGSAVLSPARQTGWNGRCCKPPRKADSDARALLVCACRPATT